MFESFVIILREGIEAALILGILIVAIRSAKRKDLEKPIWIGLGFAILGSLAAFFLLEQWITSHEEVYEGFLYFISAFFVATMMWWMHHNSQSFRSKLEKRVEDVGQNASRKEKWGLGFFAFIMIFREGVETVAFLTAVNLNTEAIMSFVGTLAGLILSVIFFVVFVRGTLHINLRRFFIVTEWILGIFILQLVINGYHEFAEAGVLPATKTSMAIIGPIVSNNSLFLLALLAMPLFILFSQSSENSSSVDSATDSSDAEKRLIEAHRRRSRNYRFAAVMSVFLVFSIISFVYAQEKISKITPLPQEVELQENVAVISASKIQEGKLYHFGYFYQGRIIRFLVMQTKDGHIRTGLDACDICGPIGYVQKGEGLMCLNCTAELNPSSLGLGGGCNPVPLKNTVQDGIIRIDLKELQINVARFEEQKGIKSQCPVCGMNMMINEATGYTLCNGKIYYFCNMSHCANTFKKNPEKFLK